jgi:hypothetical protein
MNDIAQRIIQIIQDTGIQRITIVTIRIYARDLSEDTIEATLVDLHTAGYLALDYIGFSVSYKRGLKLQ